jgi:hypothetical protein
VNFVLVGCQGARLAMAMRDESKLAHATVGYVAGPDDMPRWGQLGCNGFILLDSEQRVVSRATAPFMEVRQLAFSHVEVLLRALLAGTPPPRVCPGQLVTLTGLVKRPDLNGARALCLREASPPGGRCVLQLLREPRGQLSIKEANLQLVAAEERGDEDEEEEEGAGG